VILLDILHDKDFKIASSLYEYLIYNILHIIKELLFLNHFEFIFKKIKLMESFV